MNKQTKTLPLDTRGIQKYSDRPVRTKAGWGSRISALPLHKELKNLTIVLTYLLCSQAGARVIASSGIVLPLFRLRFTANS